MYFPVISGTAAPGDTVTVGVGGVMYTVVADARGIWTLSGPFSGLRAGNVAVAARAAQNNTVASTSFTFSAPSITISSTTSGTAITIRGVANANIQLVVDGSSTQSIKLDGAGNYSGYLHMLTGDHSVTGRYYGDGRYGVTVGPIQVTVS